MTACTVTRFAALVRDSQDSDFFRKQCVDDAVWEAAQRQAAVCTTPWRAKLWLRAKQLNGALKLRDESKPKFKAGLLRIKASAFNEFVFRLGGDRHLH
jgi:hypothetical protein